MLGRWMGTFSGCSPARCHFPPISCQADALLRWACNTSAYLHSNCQLALRKTSYKKLPFFGPCLNEDGGRGCPELILTLFQKWKRCPNSALQGGDPPCPNWSWHFFLSRRRKWKSCPNCVLGEGGILAMPHWKGFFERSSYREVVNVLFLWQFFYGWGREFQPQSIIIVIWTIWGFLPTSMRKNIFDVR